MEEGLCRSCGYFRIVFPGVIPDAIAKVERDRIEVLRKIKNEHERLINFSEKERQVAKDNEESLTKALDSERKSKMVLKAEKDRLTNRISILEKERDDYQNTSTLETRRLNDEVKRLNGQVERLNIELSSKAGEVTKLKKDLNDAWKKLAEEMDKPKHLLKGIVILEDVRYGVRCAFPVYYGTNTYGSNNTSGLHHQIRFNVRGYTFQPVHFKVTTVAKGLILEPAPGIELFQNGGLIRSGVYARQADNFMLGDRVRLNVSSV
ncbi:MAG: hypothetical protein K2H60_12400 [Muribaculaceae bacterium]|nr:hypothetical protein [Muribaculaceae bacterium]